MHGQSKQQGCIMDSDHYMWAPASCTQQQGVTLVINRQFDDATSAENHSCLDSSCSWLPRFDVNFSRTYLICSCLTFKLQNLYHNLYLICTFK